MKTKQLVLPLLLLVSLPLGVYPEESKSFAQLFGTVFGIVLPPPAVGRPLSASARGADMTRAYEALYADPDTNRQSAAFEKIKDYKVLFVPGILSNITIAVSEHLGGETSQGQYFDDQMNWLKSIGVEYERLKLSSQASIQINAKTVAAAISASTKPVIIIGHSKGGLDALDALLSNKALSSRVAGFISLQTPYAGSPVADLVLENDALSPLVLRALSEIGGNREVLFNLGTAERREYLKRNAAAVKELTARMPVLSVATWKERETGKWDTSLKPLRDLLSTLGVKSDGVVPVGSAILPCSDFIKLGGLDHSVTIRSSKTMPLDRVKFTKALLTLILSRQPSTAGN